MSLLMAPQNFCPGGTGILDLGQQLLGDIIAEGACCQAYPTVGAQGPPLPVTFLRIYFPALALGLASRNTHSRTGFDTLFAFCAELADAIIHWPIGLQR